MFGGAMTRTSAPTFYAHRSASRPQLSVGDRDVPVVAAGFYLNRALRMTALPAKNFAAANTVAL
jgi:hypothetical protein